MCLIKFTQTSSKILFDMNFYDSLKIKNLLKQEKNFKFLEIEMKFFQIEFYGEDFNEIREKTFYFCNLALSEAFLF